MKQATIKRLNFGLIMALHIRKSPITEIDIKIASGGSNDVNTEENPHFSRNSHICLKRQRTGNDVGVHSGVGEHSIRHYRKSKVHRFRTASADPACGDRRLADFLPPVAENNRAVLVLEADSVRVFDGGVNVEGDVEEDSELSQVDGEIQVGERDGVDGGDGMLGFENGETEN